MNLQVIKRGLSIIYGSLGQFILSFSIGYSFKSFTGDYRLFNLIFAVSVAAAVLLVAVPQIVKCLKGLRALSEQK